MGDAFSQIIFGTFFFLFVELPLKVNNARSCNIKSNALGLLSVI